MQHTCPQCERTFSRRSSLRNHIKTHNSVIDRILDEIIEENTRQASEEEVQNNILESDDVMNYEDQNVEREEKLVNEDLINIEE